MSSSKITQEKLKWHQIITKVGQYKPTTDGYEDVRFITRDSSAINGMLFTLYINNDGEIEEAVTEVWEDMEFVECNDIVTIMFSPNLDDSKD